MPRADGCRDRLLNDGAAATAAFDALQKSGHLIQVGLFGGELTVPPPLMALKMITVRGIFVGTPDDPHSLVEPAKRDYPPHLPLVEAGVDAEAVQNSPARLVEGGLPRSPAAAPFRHRFHEHAGTR